jgi:hypothetical protein
MYWRYSTSVFERSPAGAFSASPAAGPLLLSVLPATAEEWRADAALELLLQVAVALVTVQGLASAVAVAAPVSEPQSPAA